LIYSYTSVNIISVIKQQNNRWDGNEPRIGDIYIIRNKNFREELT